MLLLDFMYEHYNYNIYYILPITTEDERMFGVPVLVMANKQDLPQALGPSEVANKLGLSVIKDRDWRVQGTTATNGDGVYEAILEFSDMVRSFQKNRR